MKKIILVAAIIATSFSVSGCVSTSTSGSVYRPYQTQNEMTVRMGVVDSVREVTIDGGRSGVGTLTGAALGGLAGSSIGGGRGSTATGIVGAVVGGIIGKNVETNANTRKGLEITVRLDNGDLKAITQDADETFRPGERVRLLSDRRTTRVTH
ncbi:glycine zipper 2TM domain-containing protein [Undibacterium sp.]|uniref:glycine zipper 2TM domain-containing protein n=1 Tax=Undibacterium sp. TaxID=1914977 RepID=UPI003751E7F2